MKHYLADLLTLARFILAFFLIALALFGSSQDDISLGFILFMLAELTDAFDGTCATRWPFPKGKAPWYRKYAARYDMYADALAGLAAILFFTLRINFIVGAVISISYIVISIIIDTIVYGRLFGHPDDAAPKSLIHRNFKLAKKIVMTRRATYLAIMAVIAIWMLLASNWPLAAKIAIIAVALLICVFLWFFLGQRRHHISRNAVDLEKKLSSSSKNTKKIN